MSAALSLCAGSSDMPTTTITASATVRVRGTNTPQTASAVAAMLGEALGQAMTAAGAAHSAGPAPKA